MASSESNDILEVVPRTEKWEPQNDAERELMSRVNSLFDTYLSSLADSITKILQEQ